MGDLRRDAEAQGQVLTLAAPSSRRGIARLKLTPRPEGGYYRETFRDLRGSTPSIHELAAIDGEGRAGDPACLVGGEKHHAAGNLVGLP
jgi:hypothetical protein